MSQIRTINSNTLLQEQLKDKAFKLEYEAMEEEFHLAREIIKLRKEAGLTQKQLAEMVGTSQPAIARIESGEYKNLTLTFIRKIGKVLGVIPEIHFKRLVHLEL